MAKISDGARQAIRNSIPGGAAQEIIDYLDHIDDRLTALGQPVKEAAGPPMALAMGGHIPASVPSEGEHEVHEAHKSKGHLHHK
jgi:hypothetical protein